MTDAATLQARLAEAEDALHRLEMGESVVSVSTGDRSANYGRADAPRLRAYIHELKCALGLVPRRRALRVSL